MSDESCASTVDSAVAEPKDDGLTYTIGCAGLMCIFTAIVAVGGFLGYDAWALVDVAILAILIYFLLTAKSRVAAILMVIFAFLNMVLDAVGDLEAGRNVLCAGSGLFFCITLWGAVDAFKYHAWKRKQEEPG